MSTERHIHNWLCVDYSPAQKAGIYQGVELAPHRSFSVWICECGAKKEVIHEQQN